VATERIPSQPRFGALEKGGFLFAQKSLLDGIVHHSDISPIFCQGTSPGGKTFSRARNKYVVAGRSSGY
jgi:hypothetical protein